jgi:hypothetical protein
MTKNYNPKAETPKRKKRLLRVKKSSRKRNRDSLRKCSAVAVRTKIKMLIRRRRIVGTKNSQTIRNIERHSIQG